MDLVTGNTDIELRKLALELAVRYDVCRDDLVISAHKIYIWLKEGTAESANCHWVMNDAG